MDLLANQCGCADSGRASSFKTFALMYATRAGKYFGINAPITTNTASSPRTI